MLISEKTVKYPIIIVNTDYSSKNGKHWWSILDIEPKKPFPLVPSALKDL